MDISGLATIPATPSRPPTDVRPSQHVLKRAPLEGGFITVTDSSGNRVYLRQKEDAGTKVKQLICDFFFPPTFLLLYSSCLVSCFSFSIPVCLQVANSRIVPDSLGSLGLLAVPIGVLREQEIQRVSANKLQLKTL